MTTDDDERICTGCGIRGSYRCQCPETVDLMQALKESLQRTGKQPTPRETVEEMAARYDLPVELLNAPVTFDPNRTS